MKLEKYLSELNAMVKRNPEILEMEVIYSHDDEGNAYQKVISEPSLMEVEDTTEYYVEPAWEEGKDEIPNVICIN